MARPAAPPRAAARHLLPIAAALLLFLALLLEALEHGAVQLTLHDTFDDAGHPLRPGYFAAVLATPQQGQAPQAQQPDYGPALLNVAVVLFQL